MENEVGSDAEGGDVGKGFEVEEVEEDEEEEEGEEGMEEKKWSKIGDARN